MYYKIPLPNMNIVFLDSHALNAGDISWKPIAAHGTLTTYDRSTADEVVERAADADVIILNKTPLRAEHFDCLPKLRLVCVAATGYDVVDVAAARRHGIPVCNCAAYGTGAVAQMVVAHLLEVTNCVGHYAEAVRGGFWAESRDFCRTDQPLIELEGKRVAVVGYGHIGRAVIDRLRPFGMELCAVTSKPQSELPEDVHRLSLDEAFKTAHVVSLNCPLTADNRAFVNAKLLATCRPDLILINTARGALVDDAAVCEALTAGRLGAYCTDVLATEPPAAGHPLFTAPRCFITPHVAWATVEARSRIIRIIADNIAGFLKGEPQNVVNNPLNI